MPSDAVPGDLGTAFPHEYDFDDAELDIVKDSGGFGVRVGPIDADRWRHHRPRSAGQKRHADQPRAIASGTNAARGTSAAALPGSRGLYQALSPREVPSRHHVRAGRRPSDCLRGGASEAATRLLEEALSRMRRTPSRGYSSRRDAPRPLSLPSTRLQPPSLRRRPSPDRTGPAAANIPALIAPSRTPPITVCCTWASRVSKALPTGSCAF